MGMKRRKFLKAVGAGAYLALGGQGPAEQHPSGGRANIILCMADDQGWGDMAYNGHPVLKTPHFDRMASRSLRFDIPHIRSSQRVEKPDVKNFIGRLDRRRAGRGVALLTS